MPNRLRNIEVNEVSLVGSPANKRSFLLFKSARSGACPSTEAKTVKKNELIEALQKADGDEFKVDAIAELFGGKEAMAKALGLTAKAEPPATKPPAADEPKIDDILKGLPADQADAIAKALARSEKAAALADKFEARERAELRKRADALKAFGYDIDPEKATEAEIAVMEKTHGRWSEALKSVGVFRSVGAALQSEPHASVKELVKREVTRHLGREPISKTEEVVIRKRIYDAHPGLAKAVLDEERAEVRRRRTE